MKNPRLPASLQSREDLIPDAADRLLARFGYRKMTLQDIARGRHADRSADGEWMWALNA